MIGDLVNVPAGDEELGVFHVLQLVAFDEMIANFCLHLLVTEELEAELAGEY